MDARPQACSCIVGSPRGRPSALALSLRACWTATGGNRRTGATEPLGVILVATSVKVLGSSAPWATRSTIATDKCLTGITELTGCGRFIINEKEIPSEGLGMGRVSEAF